MKLSESISVVKTVEVKLRSLQGERGKAIKLQIRKRTINKNKIKHLKLLKKFQLF